MSNDTDRLPPSWQEGRLGYHRLQGTDRTIVGSRHLSFAGDATLLSVDDESLAVLRPGEWLGGGTFRNSFYLDPWARLSGVRDLRLVLEAEGDLRVRVACAVAGRAVDTIAECRFRSPTCASRAFALPGASDLPEGSRLFWHLDAHADTTVREVAFATATAPTRAPRLAVLMRTFGRRGDVDALLARFARAGRSSAFHAAQLDRIDFWLLDASGAGSEAAEREDLNLRVFTAPNLGGGGNAGHLIRLFLDHCASRGDAAPDEVLILDDDLTISFESLSRHLAFCAYRSADVICTLPVLMQSRPTTVWEDGGLWGRYNRNECNGLGRSRSLFPTLLRHGVSLDGFDRLDDFGRLHHVEYSTFIFFALPRRLLVKIGAPAAFFLRGDDIELSLRAQRAGVPIVSNPNLAAWHEPMHSLAQEYMAILHAAIINFSYSDNAASDYVRFFEDRLLEHVALGDLQGLAVYVAVLEQLLDGDSPVLTARFAAHYGEAGRRLGASPMQRLPEVERERLEARTRKSGGLVLPFLHAGYQRPDAATTTVILVNASRNEYRELEPVAFAEKAEAMERFVRLLACLERDFDSVRIRWRQRLAAASEPAFWFAIRDAHHAETVEISCARRTPASAAAPGTIGAPAGEAATGVGRDPGPLPMRELRDRLEAEIEALARWRAGLGVRTRSMVEAATADVPKAVYTRWYRQSARQSFRRWLSWFVGGPKAARTAPVLKPLPPDFEAEQYLSMNADVARSGLDPAMHYMRFGHLEGRLYRRPGNPSLAPAYRKA